MSGPGFSVCIVATRKVRETIKSNFVERPIWYHTDYRDKTSGQELCQAFRRIAAKG